MYSNFKKLVISLFILTVAGGFVFAVNKYNTNSTRGNQPKLVFEEIRQWQIASDAAVYEYTGITADSGPHDAFGVDLDGWPPYDGLRTIDGNTNVVTELTDTEYGYIATDDTDRYLVPDPGNNDRPMFWSEMIIDEPEANITQLYFYFKGYPEDAATVSIYLYDDTSGAWETSALNSASFAGTGDEVLTGTLSSNITNYINSSGKLIWGIEQPIDFTGIYVNYVKVEVTVPVTISGASNGTGTVKWAKNGVAQAESTTISASAWTISGLAAPPTTGDIITVWIDGAADSAESTAITKYDGGGSIENMVLDANILSIGSDDTGVSIALSDLDYDCLDDEDVMHNATTIATTMEVEGIGGTCTNSYDSEKIDILSGDTLTIAGDETLTTHDVAINGLLTSGGASTYNISGSWDNNADFNSSSETINFTSTGTETIDSTGASDSDIYNAVFNGSGGQWTLTTALVVNNDLTITTGTVTAPSTTLTVTGNWTNNSIFTHNSGTVLFNGTGAQTINDANTWYGLSITASSARTVSFESSVTQTIASGGSLNFAGASGQLLTLAPLTAVTDWLLDDDGAASQSVSYVSVSYSNALAGAEIDASDGTNVDGTNNDNWSFSLPITIAPNIGKTTGGTPFTITGTAFESGSTVTIGGSSATNVFTVNSTEITGIAPSGTAGAKDVVVNNPPRTLTNGFTYSANYSEVTKTDTTDFTETGSSLTNLTTNGIKIDMANFLWQDYTFSTTGGSIATNTYYYVITATDFDGNETVKGPETTGITTTGTTSSVSLEWRPIQGATRYKVYRTTSSGTYSGTNLIATITTANSSTVNTSITHTDTALNASAGAPPGSNTTDGEMAFDYGTVPSSGAGTFTAGPAIVGTATHLAYLGAHSIQRPDGKFLVVLGDVTSDTSIYDPVANSFTAGPAIEGGSIDTARAGGHSIQRPDGKFLVVLGNATSNTSIYDPVANSFAAGPALEGGSIDTANFGAHSIQRPDGKFLVVLGDTTSNTSIYDPVANSFAAGPALVYVARAGAHSIQRPDGKFLVVSGAVNKYTSIYDPVANSFVAGPLTTDNANAGAHSIQRPDGKFLVVLGDTTSNTSIYDPVANSFVAGPSIEGGSVDIAHAGAHSIQRPDGKFLVVLGNDTSNTSIYDPVANSFVAGPAIEGGSEDLAYYSAHSIQRPDGKFLVILGSQTSNTSIYDAGWNSGTTAENGTVGTYESEDLNPSDIDSWEKISWVDTNDGIIQASDNTANNIEVKTATTQGGLTSASYSKATNGGSIGAGAGEVWMKVKITFKRTVPDFSNDHSGNFENVRKGSNATHSNRSFPIPTIQSLTAVYTKATGITVSGRVCSAEPCNDTNGSAACATADVVHLKVNGVGTATSSCNTTTGAYEFTNVTATSGATITLFLNNDASTPDASAVIVSNNANITDTDFYDSAVVARSQTGTITIADMMDYDSDEDSDIRFDAETGILNVEAGHELHIWTGDTFAPGGTVTLAAGSGSDLHLDDSATFTAGGAISIGGSWTADTSSTFTHNDNDVTFTAGVSGQTITTNGQSFYNLIFDGSSGEWTATTDSLIVSHDLMVTAGNFDTGAVTNTFNTISGTTSITGTLTISSATGVKRFIKNVTINDSGVWNETAAAEIIFDGNLTNNAATWTASTGEHKFMGTDKIISGSTAIVIPNVIILAPITNSNTLTVGTLLTVYSALTNDGTVTTVTALSGTSEFINAATGTLNIGGTSGIATLTATASGNTVNYNGTVQTVKPVSYHHLILSNSDAKTMTSVTTIGGDLTISGAATMTGNAAFTVTGALNYSSSGSTTLTGSTAISIGKYNQSAGTIVDNANTITVTGTGAGVWTKSGGTFTATGTATFTGSDPGIGASNFNNLIINVSGGGTTATLEGTITVSNDLTISAGTLDVSATDYGITVSGNWDNNGTFTCQGGTVTFDASSGDKTINDGSSAFYNIKFDAAATSWTYTDEGTTTATNSTELTSNVTGTVNFINARTGASPTVTAGTLNVDWYLGIHVVNASGLGNIDTGADDITISENTGSPVATIWKYSSGWGSPATSQTTGTDSNGTNIQPHTDGAIKIREYSNVAGTPTYYLYNIEIDWQTSYGAYDYYDDYGENYITSTLNTSSGHNEIIDSDWRRETPGTMNADDTLNDVPTYGSWYVGMLTGLSVDFTTGASITFDNLSLANDFSDTDETKTQITVSTSATNGYVVTAWEDGLMTCSSCPGTPTIQNFYGTYATPQLWSDVSYCKDNSNYCGFGFTSSDTTIDTFGDLYVGATKYAGFPNDSTNPIRVMDYDSPADGIFYDITYRISVSNTQQPGDYSTTIVYVVTAEY